MAYQEVDPAVSPKASPAQTTPAASVHEIMKNRQAMAAEVGKLAKEGASPEEIARWHENNAGRLAAIQQKLMALAALQESEPRHYVREVQIPPGASVTMEAFLMERAKLINDRIRLENQMLQASPWIRQEALEAWDSQNAAAMKNQISRAREISAEPQPAALAKPPALQIPADATQSMRDFLTLRHTLMMEEAAMERRLGDAPARERQQALQNWKTQNHARFKTLQEAAAHLTGLSNPTD